MFIKRLPALLLSGAFLAAPLAMTDATAAYAGPCMDCRDGGGGPRRPIPRPPVPRPDPAPVPAPAPAPAPAPVPAGPGQMSVHETLRGVTVHSHMEITDGEDWPFSDERASADAWGEQVVGNDAANVLTTAKRMGGEIRVELDLAARSFPSGEVLVTGEARLYEGTSEDTGNLRASVPIEVTTAPGQQTVPVSLRAGGDRAEIDITVVNHDVVPVEAPRRVTVHVLDVMAHDTEDTFGADEFYLLGGVHAGDAVSELNTEVIPVNDNDSVDAEDLREKRGVKAFTADVPGDAPFGLYLHPFDEDAGTDWKKIEEHGERLRKEMLRVAAESKNSDIILAAGVGSVIWEAINMAGANDADDDLGSYSHVQPGQAGLVADLGFGTRIYEASFDHSVWHGFADISDWSYTVRYQVTVTPLAP